MSKEDVSLKTKRAFSEGLRKVTGRLDGSLEAEKAQNDFLASVPAFSKPFAPAKSNAALPAQRKASR